MKEKIINLYKINELKQVNKKAYDKIINDTRDIIINCNFDYAIDAIQEILKNNHNLDIDNNNIEYSISYCQGDGFSFTDKYILSYTNIKNKSNLNAFELWIINNLTSDEIELLLSYLNDGYNLNIERISHHHYCHPYTCIIDFEYYYSNDDENYVNKINNFIDDLCKKLFKNVYLSICYEIEKYLYSLYDVDDDECLEYLTDYDDDYDINGNLY